MDQEGRSRDVAAHRLMALCAVALIVLSGGLLKAMAAETPGRPTQSVAWLFGPPPASTHSADF